MTSMQVSLHTPVSAASVFHVLLIVWTGGLRLITPTGAVTGRTTGTPVLHKITIVPTLDGRYSLSIYDDVKDVYSNADIPSDVLAELAA